MKKAFGSTCGDRRFVFELLNRKPSSKKMKKAFGSTRGVGENRTNLKTAYFKEVRMGFLIKVTDFNTSFLLFKLS